MNVYCEFLLDRIRIKIDGEELAFQVGKEFYSNKMLSESLTNARLRGFVKYHKTDLNIFQRLSLSVTKNKIFILVSQEVQRNVKIRHIHDYAAKFMDGGSMYIIPKPVTFNSARLEDIEKIRTEYLSGPSHGDSVVAQLRALTSRRQMEGPSF